MARQGEVGMNITKLGDVLKGLGVAEK